MTDKENEVFKRDVKDIPKLMLDTSDDARCTKCGYKLACGFCARCGTTHHYTRPSPRQCDVYEAIEYIKIKLNQPSEQLFVKAIESLAGRTRQCDGEVEVVPLSLFNEAVEVLQTIKLNAGYGKEANMYACYRLDDLTKKRADYLAHGHLRESTAFNVRDASGISPTQAWRPISEADKDKQVIGAIKCDSGFGAPFEAEYNEETGRWESLRWTEAVPHIPTHFYIFPLAPQEEK